MKTALDYISSKRIAPSNISNFIADREALIKRKLPNVFNDVDAAMEVGQALCELSSLKTAKIIMESENYKTYAQNGKTEYYTDFLSSL